VHTTTIEWKKRVKFNDIISINHVANNEAALLNKSDNILSYISSRYIIFDRLNLSEHEFILLDNIIKKRLSLKDITGNLLANSWDEL